MKKSFRYYIEYLLSHSWHFRFIFLYVFKWFFISPLLSIVLSKRSHFLWYSSLPVKVCFLFLWTFNPWLELVANSHSEHLNFGLSGTKSFFRTFSTIDTLSSSAFIVLRYHSISFSLARISFSLIAIFSFLRCSLCLLCV